MRLPPVLLLSLALPASLPAAPETDPWQAALAFDYNVASDGFAALHRAAPDDPRLAIARASGLLVRQPRTETNIRDARELLSDALHTADETLAPLALFLLARIEIDHLANPDPASARERLLALRRDHPEHPLADHAAVQLAYLAADDAASPADTLAAAEALLATVRAPEAARDLHSLLAALLLRHLRDPAAALPHLIAARAVGHQQPLRDADLDLSIANLARETGDPDLARRHYAAFLAAAPRDTRASTARRLLAALDTP